MSAPEASQIGCMVSPNLSREGVLPNRLARRFGVGLLG
jgi:hypothetical protein